MAELSDKTLPPKVYEGLLTEALAQWPTGAQADFAAGVAFQKALPQNQNLPARLADAAGTGATLVQPRGGASTVEEQLTWLSIMEEEEADILSVTVDPFTRQGRYEEAEKALEDYRQTGKKPLAGFPVALHGVEGCRRVTQGAGAPVQLRFAGTDPRLLAAIGFAGGFTGIEGGGVSSNIPYVKNEPLERTIAHWQLVDRLIGRYAEEGVILNREPYGPLTGTLVPPCVSHSIAVLEALLAAKQGVKSITVGYGQCGNLIQDVAAIRTLEPLTRRYLERFGYGDVAVTTVFHQWMGGYPPEPGKACAVIAWGSTAAALAGATKVLARPTQETQNAPTLEGLRLSLQCTRQTISMLTDQRVTPSPQLELEMSLITEETTAILEHCLELGGEDVAKGVVAAFAAGMLDVPFAPSRLCAGKLLPARDNRGAVRILNPGALPLPKDSLDYHRQMIEERCTAERRKASFQMVIDDVYAISTGKLVGRPK